MIQEWLVLDDLQKIFKSQSFFLQNGEKVEINNLEVEEKLMFKNKY